MAEQTGSPKVSVIVPVYNGARTIREVVNCLLKQTLPPHEIIVVDDGSTDGTAETLKEFAGQLVLLRKRNGGPASARNQGIGASSGELVAFTDSDCLPQSGWLSELVKGFDGPGVGGVGGVTKRADRGMMSEYADESHLLGHATDAEGKITTFPTANACFRKDVLVEARLFDEYFTKPGGEDVELCYKIRGLGYELRLAEEALVLHHHRRTLRAFLKTMSNYGEGQYALDVKWPERRRMTDPRRELLRSVVAARSMLKRLIVYRTRYGLKRAALFSFVDHYGHAAYAWGYLRGQRSAGPGVAQRTTFARSEDSSAKEHEGLATPAAAAPLFPPAQNRL